MEGSFLERPDDVHVALRQRVLRSDAWYPPPPGLDSPPVVVVDPSGIADSLSSGLAERGSANLQLDRQLTNAELIGVAAELGTLQAQRDSRLEPWMEDDVILNLRADNAEIQERDWRLLFAENYVMLHTELANRPLAIQPQYLLFQCVEPPVRDTGGQTVLVAMDDVRRRLTDRQADVLAVTRHADYPDSPPILSHETGQWVFTYKDAEAEPVPWSYTGPQADVTPEEVEGALRALLQAMYDPSLVFGLHWEKAAIGAFDNHRFFHGRTAVRHQTEGNPRHLRQIKVFAADAPPFLVLR
jgi:alpha-ketoglutarate-dependent taurine dioxygenase